MGPGEAQNGGHRIYATRPKVARGSDGVLMGRDDHPVVRRDGRLVRDWSDPRAVPLYGPDGKPLTERNPSADRVPVLGPDDLVRLAYDDDLTTNRRDRLHNARKALGDMAAAGAVVIESDGDGRRVPEPPPLLFMAFGESHSFSDTLECVAEGAMADIMKKCGQQDNACAGVVEAPLPTADDLDELARCVIDADAVSESAACGAGVDQVGEAELTDAP